MDGQSSLALGAPLNEIPATTRKRRPTPTFDPPANLLVTTLAGQDTFFGGQGKPLVPYEFPTPRRFRPLPPIVDPPNLLIIPGPPTTAPGWVPQRANDQTIAPSWMAQLNAEYKQALYVFAIPGVTTSLCSFKNDTQPPIITGGAALIPGMMIPKGASQKVDELNGQSTISTLTLEAIDPGGQLKALAANVTALGQICTLQIGFPGIDLSQFVTVYTGRIQAIGRAGDGKITITIQDLLLQLVQDIFLNGGPDPWTVGAPKNNQRTPPPAVRDNGIPISKDNPRYFNGNPINLMLAVLQNELGIGQTTPPNLVIVTGGGSGTGQAGFGINPAWSFYDGINDSTLINPNPFIDIPSILNLRDLEFSGDRMEFTFESSQNGKTWIEDNILKPLGLYFVTRRTGELALKTMKHIVGPTDSAIITGQPNPYASIIDSTKIIGIPETQRWPIINVVNVDIPADTDATSTVTLPFVSQASINQFGYKSSYAHSITADGMRFVYGGFGKLFLLANRVFNRHGFGTPEYTFTTYLQFCMIGLGDFVVMSHPLVLDLLTGLMGITNVLCEVTDRDPDYANGRITFKAIDTRFISPPGPPGDGAIIPAAAANIPVWGSASTAQQNQYMYISDNVGKQSDGNAGKQIF